MINLIEKAKNHKQRVAIKSNDQSYTYDSLLKSSRKIANQLLRGRADLDEERIAFLVAPSYDYVRLQWGIWRAGGIAVPLCTKHPLPSIQYVLDDTQAETVIYSEEYESLLSPLFDNTKHQFLRLKAFTDQSGILPDVDLSRRAMILYTSGTTGNPKGVVSTHQNIECQITSLTSSWEWEQNDHILNVLPMHHVHGIVNVTLCALWSGACCEFLSKFDSQAVFNVFTKGDVNLFMAVPTIYFKLIAHWNDLPQEEQIAVSEALKHFRLMVSGSAALPVSVLETWRSISGQTLLERYGMTEMGMAISNSYRGTRNSGFIGLPLANVTIRLANENDVIVDEGISGEIQVKGPNIFKEYWQKPEATKNTFTGDGWFKTGDIAVFENGNYRILGRNSVDIIKSGGYKISALEIEEVLRKHPKVKECGVVGIPDDEWGEIIGASLILEDGNSIDLDKLKDWLKERLPLYQLPRKYIYQDDLPRNVMGKVTKNDLKKFF
tara:strand:+ start:2321 stop:3799 length:1479 start_codon:yes stop_codon:yes gene_type:complete